MTHRRASATGYGDGTCIRCWATRRSPAPVATAMASPGVSSRSTSRSVASSGGRAGQDKLAASTQACHSTGYGRRRGTVAQKMPGLRAHAYDLAAAALALGASSAALAAVHDVQTHRFENGLTLHVAAGHPAPVAAVQARVGAGSADAAAHAAA